MIKNKVVNKHENMMQEENKIVMPAIFDSLVYDLFSQDEQAQ